MASALSRVNASIRARSATSSSLTRIERMEASARRSRSRSSALDGLLSPAASPSSSEPLRPFLSNNPPSRSGDDASKSFGCESTCGSSWVRADRALSAESRLPFWFWIWFWRLASGIGQGCGLALDGEGFADPANAGPHARSPPSRPEALPAGVAGCSGAFVDGGFRRPPSGAIGEGAAEFAKDAVAMSHDARVSSTPSKASRCPRRLGLGAGSPRVLASLIGRGVRGRSGVGIGASRGRGRGRNRGELIKLTRCRDWARGGSSRVARGRRTSRPGG